MAPRRPKKPKCQVCSTNDPRYTCSGCLIAYCSVPCYKQHKATECSAQPAAGPSTVANADPETPTLAPADEPMQTDTDAGAGAEEGNGNGKDGHNPDRNGNGDGDGDGDGDGGPSLEDPPPPLRTLASLNWPYVPDESAYPDPLKRDDPKTLQLHHYEAIATSPAIRTALAAHEQLVPLLRSLDALRGPERERALERALGVAAPDIANREGAPAVGGDVLALRALAEAVEAAVRGDNRAVLGLDWGMGEE